MTTTRNDRGNYDGSASPCDGCARKQVCDRYYLACADFSFWLNEGRNATLRPDKRAPSHSLYKRLFPNAPKFQFKTFRLIDL